MRKYVSLLVLLVFLGGCGAEGPPVQTAEELPTIAVTHWTENTELFMEHPPLVAGEKARFAVHLTDLSDFTPLTAGQVVIELRSPGGSVKTFSSDAPSRPGIFGVDVLPSEPGTYSMTVQLDSPSLKDVHELGTVAVYADATQAETASSEEAGEAISFLKEQQWTLEFATDTATERPLRESLRVPAEVQPRTGGEAEVSAPVAGRVSATSPIPAVGTTVARGRTLASLIPRTGSPADRATLEFSVAEATHELERFRKDRERVERLFAAGAIPSRRLEEAQAKEAIAEAKLKAARSRLAQHETTRSAEGNAPGNTPFLLRAPLSGVVAESHATAGASVEAGEFLFKIVAVDRVYVVASVPEAAVARLRQLSGAELEIPGVEQPLTLGRPVSVGQVIDPDTRTLSVIYQVSNHNRLLAVGQAVFLRLFTSATLRATAVPESAVVDDGGRPVVFVQVTGESFERRPVRLGNREGGYVHVLEGIKPGERVVTRGAYLVRLAALSTQIPAHGHGH